MFTARQSVGTCFLCKRLKPEKKSKQIQITSTLPKQVYSTYLQHPEGCRALVVQK